MNEEFLKMLVEMGFTKEKAVKGLKMTGDKSVESAMEWILNNADQFEAGTSNASTSNISDENEEESQAPSEDAKSLKCDDCGKLFTSQVQLEFHATKSGHTNFSESTEEKKPLTEEEKKEQLKKIEETLKEKRKEREEKEKAEALEREKIRIRSGKEISEAKKRLEDLEMKKMVEERKREKEEEKQARLRVKKLIEADKLARKGLSAEPDNAVKKPETKSDTNIKKTEPKDYSETRIQLRLTNGEIITQKFSSTEQLSAVRLYVEMNRTDGDVPFKFMTNFPRKVFTDEEYDMPLIELGLVPSAVIILTRSIPV